MAIEELLRVVRPPEHPLEPGDLERWRGVEQELDTPLPRDYLDFCVHYGTGYFDAAGPLYLFNPFGADFLADVRRGCDFLRRFRGLLGRYGVPYGVFPDNPGWLPFGEDEDGNRWCWVTEGQPSEWPILLVSKLCTNFQQVSLPLTSFLAGLFCGRLTTVLGDGLGENVNTGPVHFFPTPTRRLDPPEETDSYRATPIEVEWLGPDSLGRPQGVRAILGPQQVDAPHAPFTVYPAWWGQLPTPRLLWVRHHLLGWRLGGPGGDALHNLIPLTHHAQEVMRTLENWLAMLKVKQQVVYTVRVTYEGMNPYPGELLVNFERPLEADCFPYEDRIRVHPES